MIEIASYSYTHNDGDQIWDEWQKYKCNHIKEESKNSSFTDALTDYEPYSAKFEDIFRDYCGNQDRKVWSMQCLAYWVEPVILMENDGSYTARKNDSDGVKVGDTDA